MSSFYAFTGSDEGSEIYDKLLNKYFRLNARKPRKAYKSTNAYLDAIYRANRERIDSATHMEGNQSRLAFKKTVRQKTDNEGKSLRQALKELNRWEVYVPKEMRGRLAVMTGLKLNNQMHQLKKMIGYKTKFDMNKLEYINNNTYIYRVENKDYWAVKIQFTSSPIQITLEEQYDTL